MSVATGVLALLVIGAVVYAAGAERTKAAASTGGSGLKRAVQSSAFAGAAGLGLGLQFGNDLLSAVLAEPGFALAAVAGISGSLGIGGFLGDITALQFLLIGLIAFLVIYGIFGGDE